MADPPILLDVSRLIWRQWTRRLPTGIDRVCLAYLEHFGPMARAVVQFRRFRLILDRSTSAKLINLLLNGSKWFRWQLIGILVSGVVRDAANAAGQVYLNVGHTGLNSPHLLPWLTRHRLRPLYLVHDLIPITHPQLCRDREAVRHEERMRNALRSAHGIIVNSKATERDLATFASAQGLSPPPTVVAWLGIDGPPPESANSVRPKRPYFVVVGTIEARKNHLLVLKAWAELVAHLGEDAPELIIIGQRGWEAEEATDVLDNPGSLQGHVRELGRCDDATMHSLISGAQALLMPSFTEGFGLPVVEALEMGTPVIASDLEVFREIASDIPEYLDSSDLPGWVNAVMDYTSDSERRQAQLSRISKFVAPCWSSHFKRVDDFLKTF